MTETNPAICPICGQVRRKNGKDYKGAQRWTHPEPCVKAPAKKTSTDHYRARTPPRQIPYAVFAHADRYPYLREDLAIERCTARSRKEAQEKYPDRHVVLWNTLSEREKAWFGGGE
jgi:hypothetical protein